MTANLKKIYLLAVLTLAMLSGLNGCVTTSDMDNLRMELRQTKGQLERKIDGLDQEMNKADSIIRDEIKESNSPVQNRQANIWAEVKNLKTEVAKLQGTVDSFAMSIGEINRESNSTISLTDLARQFSLLRMELESQLNIKLDLQERNEINKQKVTSQVATSTGNSTGTTPEIQVHHAKPTTDPAQALYNKALESFKKRKYNEAIRDWSEFTGAFPGHSLLPNALFWEGESYYQLGDYPNAALKYQIVIGKYPKSNKYRSSLLKQGICLIKLGKTKSGKYILEDLIKKAPDSAEAKRAKKYLNVVK